MAARLLPPLLFVLAALFAQACDDKGPGTPPVVPLTPSQLMDPEMCKTCHPTAYQEWSGSMHAYATEDPVFRAMNKRAQRETQGSLGDFCVKCHAPMAVQLGMTTDGLNLDDVPPEFKGVTCYFCHAAVEVAGTHNNPLVLANDDSLFGPFDDPASGTPHKGLYSRLLDSATLESASMCGSCHDIQNQHGAPVERTFQEWQDTRFSAQPNGSTCSDCHMKTQQGPASTVSTKVRTLHAHGFPAVDLAVTDFPEADTQRMQVQTLLDQVLQPTLCYNDLYKRIELTLENVSAGHSFPSGATPDRRAWIEMTAYSGDSVIYSTGGTPAFPLEGSTDPDLWLMRDCIFDDTGKETNLFWQAATLKGEAAVPGSVIQNVAMPETFNKSHPQKFFPTMGMLPMMPDRINLKIHLQAIGDDVLQALVDSGDLDATIPPKIARYTLGGAASFDWTPSTAKVQVVDNATLLCVIKPIKYRTNVAQAVSNARCAQ